MAQSHTLRQVYTGLASGPGRASGPVLRWERATPDGNGYGDPCLRLDTALRNADARLTAAIDSADAVLAPILQAQRLMLDDPELRDGIHALLAAGVAPAQAVVTVAGQLAEVLEGAGSDYFRARAIDVRALGTLIVEALTGASQRRIPAGAVVLARELAPMDTAELAQAGIAALVTVNGGPTCHAAIMARAWGIPAVVGAPAAVLEVENGALALVDGNSGCVTINPVADEINNVAAPSPQVHMARRIPLYANIGSVAEAVRAVAIGVEGVGLLRTEFLFQDRATAPSEEEQAAEYAAILRTMNGRPVTVRTLDIGADKPAPFLPMPSEPNPQLGLRGIRLCLREETLLRTQFRALLRASTTGPVKIMLPMVTTPGEVTQARVLLMKEAAALRIPAPPLGVMIEVPMAALAAPELAAVSDFFSLGTNDLLQFLLAADRQHAGVGYLHAGDHPGAWRLIASVIDAAHAAHLPVSVCGEWGADAEKLARLIDLGIDAASVAVGVLNRVRGWIE